MMIRKQDAVRGRASMVAVLLGAAVLLSLAGCGADSTTPSTPRHPGPDRDPGPDADSVGAHVQPDAAGDLRHQITILDAATYRKTLKATPLVANYDGYCGKVGFDPNQCTARRGRHRPRPRGL